MHINKNRIKIFLPLGFLLFISIIVYRVWFSFSVFAYGDGIFIFNNSIKDSVFPSFWNAGITLWKYPFNFFYGLWGQLGYGSNVTEKFLVFWPIVLLGPIAGFLLVRKITKSDLAGFIGSLVFSFNTYFLSIDTQGHIFLTLGFVWGTFAFLSFIYLLDTRKKILVPITTFFLCIAGFSDFRTLYVVAGIISLYFLYNQFFIEKNWRASLKANFLLFFSVFFLFLLLNLFWIIPNVTTGTLTSNEYLNRSIIEGNFYNIQNATALFYPFWTGAEPTWFLVQNIPFFFWLYPILAFTGFIIGRKNKPIVYFGLLALIGIFLTKQDSAPFGQIYTFFYNHVPGFSAFREASKFYFVIVISYSVLIGSFAFSLLNYLKSQKISKYIIVFLIALLPLWNTVPMLTGSIKTMFIPKTIPADIEKVNTYFSKEEYYSGIFWININHIWIMSNNKNPVIEGDMATVKEWEELSNTFDNAIDLNSTKVEGKKLKTFFASEVGRRLLSQGSYGYVILNLKNNELTDANVNAKSWESLGNYLKTVAYLKPVNIGVNDILIFKDTDARPHIYKTSEKESLEKDVNFQRVAFVARNPSEYSVVLNKQSSPFYLNFSERFHPDWKIYKGDFNLISFLFGKQKQLPDTDHFKSAAGFNSFYVNPNQLCMSYPCSLTLFFKPQGYLYGGLIVSIAVLIGAIGLSVYLYKKKI